MQFTHDSPLPVFAGSEMGERVRTFDWAKTPLGPPDQWPQSLRTTVGIVLASPFPKFLAWGPELIAIYNDAYRPILGTKPEALGRSFPEIWAEAWETVGPIAEDALAGKASYFENLPITLNRRGYEEQTWFTFGYSPVWVESGEVGGVLCTVHETTGEVLARRALAAERERLAELIHQAPGIIAVHSGPEHRIEIVNEAYQDYARREVVGRTAAEAFPELVEQGFIALLDEVLATGEAKLGRAAPVTVQRADGPQRLYLDFVYQPIREPDGRISGIFVEGFDVTERTLASERQRLLLNELNHRVKNTLATVQSITHQTLRSAESLEAARLAIEERLASLARAHDTLTRESWAGASILDVVSSAVGPFHSRDRPRFEIAGPSLWLTPRQALALAMGLHELATNAVKHGALSVPQGSVEIAWRCDAERVMQLTWREKGGPPVKPPSRRGFGTRLLTRVLGADLGGHAELVFEPEGVVCRVSAPPQPADSLTLALQGGPSLGAANGSAP